MNSSIISVKVNNHSGVLLRITGLFSRRGFNIKSLIVCETENPQFSRMTIVADGDEPTLKQIARQLYKLEDVIKVSIINSDDASTSELLLIKLEKDENIDMILGIAHRYGAMVSAIGEETITLELSGPSIKIENFLRSVTSRDIEIVELARSGLAALYKGDECFIDY